VVLPFDEPLAALAEVPALVTEAVLDAPAVLAANVPFDAATLPPESAIADVLAEAALLSTPLAVSPTFRPALTASFPAPCTSDVASAAAAFPTAFVSPPAPFASDAASVTASFPTPFVSSPAAFTS
jgi:hypothetical protein